MILDRATQHKARIVLDALEELNGQVKMLFLPAGCPDLSAIAEPWRRMKAAVLVGPYIKFKKKCAAASASGWTGGCPPWTSTGASIEAFSAGPSDRPAPRRGILRTALLDPAALADQTCMIMIPGCCDPQAAIWRTLWSVACLPPCSAGGFATNFCHAAYVPSQHKPGGKIHDGGHVRPPAAYLPALLVAVPLIHRALRLGSLGVHSDTQE